jgi:lipid II:glycine glycyltransferase (peptidoglycan interpeptide bridge formation enzyme)
LIDDKEQYREFCKTKQNLPVFLYDWWLDAVCGPENWQIAMVWHDNEIAAFMPYYIKKVLCFNISTMPMLTQFLGPWVNYPNELKTSKKAEFEKKLMNELIEKLPVCDHFEQNFHFSVSNWLPFYWKGYSQTTKYTYLIEDISDTDHLYSRFHSNKRNRIKKAAEQIEIKFDLDPEVFYDHHKTALSKKNKNIAYSRELFRRIHDSAVSRNSGRTIYALDKNGSIHSALFVVWSKYSAYYLINSIDPDFNNSESIALLTWEMIKYLSKKTYRFDFEGSMIESVERSFRQFGTEQKAYFNISRHNSTTYKAFRSLREKLRKE